MMETRHFWVVGSSRSDREAAVHRLQANIGTAFVLDAHRRLRGPYSAGGALLRRVVPVVLAVDHDLAVRHDVEILSIAPELHAVLKPTRETLTSLAVPDERTRYYSKIRTQRLAHGVCEFLGAGMRYTGIHTVIVENVEHADPSDVELLATLLRRLDPGVLRIVVCTREPSTVNAVDDTLAALLVTHAERVDAPPAAASDSAPPACPGWAYVLGDCTSEDSALVSAYDQLNVDDRRRMHDTRAAELIARDELSLKLGAIPFHLERGSDLASAGADALEYAADYCSAMGFYYATVEMAERALEVIVWEPTLRRYKVMSRLTTALAVLERPAEVEQLYDRARAESFAPMVHMGAAYATAMLYTRHYEAGNRDNDKARAWINAAISFASMIHDPAARSFQSVFMRNGLALVEVHCKNLAAALDLVTEGIEALDRDLEPNEHQLHRSVLKYNRGQVYAAMGRLEEAIADYTAVIEVDPAWGEYYFDRGNLLRQIGRDDLALADYEAAIRITPAFHEAVYNRGDVLLSGGDINGALVDFNYVIDLDPNFVDAYVNRAGIRLSLGQVDLACEDATRGLELDRNNAYLHLVLGQVLAERADLAAARAQFDLAVHIDGSIAEAWSGRAAIAHAMGDHEAALSDLAKALQLDPQDVGSLFNRAFVYRRLGYWDEAEQDLAAAASLAPEDEDILAALRDCHERVSA